MTDQDYTGAVVAIEPATGEILAMVSTPSYDPNPLASHSDAVQRQAYNDLVSADPSPLLNRAIGAVYPPGSTFKLVIAVGRAAAGLHPGDPGHRRAADHPAGHRRRDPVQLRRRDLRQRRRRGRHR